MYNILHDFVHAGRNNRGSLILVLSVACRAIDNGTFKRTAVRPGYGGRRACFIVIDVNLSH